MSGMRPAGSDLAESRRPGRAERLAARRLGPLWRHRDFRRLWSAQAVSEFGSQVTLLALPLTALLTLHARPYEVALLATADTLPSLALGIPAGVWVDRVRRRPVMIAADLGRAAVLVSVPAAYGLGILTLPHLYAAAVLNGSLSVLFEIASQAYLPSVVGPGQLLEANAKFESSRVIGWAAGPGAGGGLVSLVTAPVALLADAASFVASAGFIGSVVACEQPREPTPDAARSMRRELREGASYVLRHPYLRPLLASHALANLALGVVWAIVIVYAVRVLGLSAALVGLAFSVGQIGGFAGAVFGQRVAQLAGVGRTIVVAFSLFGPATLLLAIAAKSAAMLFVAIGWALENLARALYGISATSVRQALVPNHMQARAVGFTTTAGTGAFPLGTAIGGVLAEGFGLRLAMVIGALISFLPLIPVAASPVRSLHDLPE
jgi:MFS family permease